MQLRSELVSPVGTGIVLADPARRQIGDDLVVLRDPVDLPLRAVELRRALQPVRVLAQKGVDRLVGWRPVQHGQHRRLRVGKRRRGTHRTVGIHVEVDPSASLLHARGSRVDL